MEQVVVAHIDPGIRVGRLQLRAAHGGESKERDVNNTEFNEWPLCYLLEVI